MTFRYDTSGRWFKGNTHLHSTASDGGKTFDELAELYASADYDFLFRTDHWVTSDVASDPASFPLLWLDGVELDGHDAKGSYFHVVCLGKVDGISREDGLEAGLKSAREQGALLILAHPHWSGNSLDDCLRWQFDGVEVYNHVCHWLNGKSCGMIHWDAALMQDPNTLALAVDDAHLKPEHMGWNGGWIVVNAPDCTADELIPAIRRGNFYSSCGPQINSLSFDGELLHAETSPIKFARLVGPASRGTRVGDFDSAPIESLSVEVPKDWQYAYLEIEDMQGRRARTNSLFSITEPSG
ncbi:MAG: hypothetical protein HN919_21640 [Verrucomicrobia bacterium]|jgi:hypothetical protein|nr:hypothetical protein [Verrucomicrobiota bacterium]MBT7068914.1 hypothetical protein [Verrucomicrobiota bacterium]MBT7701773.1 hypothetical protein [Verrucomicrobiota bacterium]